MLFAHNGGNNTTIWLKPETWDSWVTALPSSHESNQGQRAPSGLITMHNSTRSVTFLMYKLLKSWAWNGPFVRNKVLQRTLLNNICWVFPRSRGVSHTTDIHTHIPKWTKTRAFQLESCANILCTWNLMYPHSPTSFLPSTLLWQNMPFVPCSKREGWGAGLLGLWEQTWINGLSFIEAWGEQPNTPSRRSYISYQRIFFGGKMKFLPMQSVYRSSKLHMHLHELAVNTVW